MTTFYLIFYKPNQCSDILKSRLKELYSLHLNAIFRYMDCNEKYIDEVTKFDCEAKRSASEYNSEFVDTVVSCKIE